MPESFPEYITKQLLTQFEIIRKSALCNMINYYCVQRHASQLNFHDLASLFHDEYLYVLRNYTELITRFEIDQSKTINDLTKDLIE